MASKFKRYEAAVKLNTGEVTQYHNINTGLFKFHRFVCAKFSDSQKWVSYTIRRIDNKEVIGTFKNSKKKEIQAVRLYLNYKEGSKKTGFILSIPIIRNNAKLRRDVFVANTQVLAKYEDSICIAEWLYTKIQTNALRDLLLYYKEKGQDIEDGELKIASFQMDQYNFISDDVVGTEPNTDYP